MSERNVTGDPKYKPSNNIPFAFNEGDHVIKRRGDYTFCGVVLAAFRKRSGSPRYVVENEDGIVHVFNHDQLEPVTSAHRPEARAPAEKQ